ncbi:hypothetical protein K1719_017762 [Acacia pycnantha]|nr:hypothetical protein K1719_017762 [Acacia pycnantha]
MHRGHHRSRKPMEVQPKYRKPSDSQPRGLDWLLKGDPISMAASDQEWQPLMQAKVDLIIESSCNNIIISMPRFQVTKVDWAS